MTQTRTSHRANLLGLPDETETAQAIVVQDSDPAKTGEALGVLKTFAARSASTRRPGAEAGIPARGQSLGAPCSFILAETITAALPAVEDAAAFHEARRQVFGDRAPRTMSAVIEGLQDQYGFADGARLHSDGGSDVEGPYAVTGGKGMLDTRVTNTGPDIPLVKVADHVEMGRLVAEWATGQRARPETVDDLKRELSGIAEVPARIKKIEFCQEDMETLVIRLPVKEVIERAVNDMADPECESRYPFPQFYADFFQPGFCPVMTPLDILMARLGDHTIEQCR
jgi:hypothetical protein